MSALRAIAAKISADSKQIGTPSLETCELMVLDIQAYGECALTLCRNARTRFAGPILLFTYEYDERFHLEAYRAGADESITKPIGIALAVSKVLHGYVEPRRRLLNLREAVIKTATTQ